MLHPADDPMTDVAAARPTPRRWIARGGRLRRPAPQARPTLPPLAERIARALDAVSDDARRTERGGR
jgi:hypothetical protein